MGKAIFCSGTRWRKEYEGSWSAHNGSSYWSKPLLWCCSISGWDHPGKTPKALKSTVREANGWSTAHPSCMPTALMEWVQLLQERTCGTGLAEPHKCQVRPEQQWDPTALCHSKGQLCSPGGQSEQRRFHNQSHEKSFITKEKLKQFLFTVCSWKVFDR